MASIMQYAPEGGDNSAPCRQDAAMVSESEDENGRAAAHRPSRRQEIIHAAVRVFARTGFADASIQDIADEAGVVPTAVYYHFEGKEELFDVCIERCWESLSKMTEQARPTGTGAEAFPQVLEAAWAWSDKYPEAAALLYLHMPGATPRSRRIHEAQLGHHTRRAFDYLKTGAAPLTRRQAATLHARQSLTVRALISLVVGVHPMRMHDGPLNGLPARDLRAALEETTSRLLSV